MKTIKEYSIDEKILIKLKNDLGISEEILDIASNIYQRVCNEELLPVKEKLEEKLHKIIERGVSIGFILRYKDLRIKPFDSIIRNWLPRLASIKGPDLNDHFRSFLSNEFDLLGARIVALNLSDVVKIARLILGDEQFGWTRKDLKNFYKNPRESGYRSWHLKTEFYPELDKNRNVKCEIQIRTGLEDVWGEWEHELIYKKPLTISEQTWHQWTNLSRAESKLMAIKLYDLAVWMDRQMERFKILDYPATMNISDLLGNKANVNINNIVDEPLNKFKEHTEVLAANLLTGFDSNHLFISFDPDGFIGLSLRKREKKDFCFTFEDLIESRTTVQLTAKLSSDYLKDIDKEGSKILLENLKGLKSLQKENDLIKDWNKLLIKSFFATKKHHRKNLGRLFFNEYQSRLNNYKFKGINKLNAEFLTLFLVRTNFAFEVCTNYAWDGNRSIVVDQKTGKRDNDVDQIFQSVICKLKHLSKISKKGSFEVLRHGANPIGVHVNLITFKGNKRFIVVTRRGMGTADTGEWQTSVSGVTCPRQSSIELGGDVPGYIYGEEIPERSPSLFLAAQRELFEELGVFVPLDQIRVIALLNHKRSGQPVLVAEAYSDKSLEEIRECAKAAEEKWEINQEGIAAIELNQSNLDILLTKGETLRHNGLTLPSLLYMENSKLKWQERSKVAILLSFLRHTQVKIAL